MSSLTKEIKQKASELGFDLAGVSPVGSFPENQFYKEWLARGFAGEMKYMEKEPERRESVANLFPEARSIISCGLNYNTDRPYSIKETDKRKGWISRYAWGDDYHDIIKDKLSILLDFITASAPYETKSRLYVDTGPVLDRVYGRYGGIGWFGKNTCIINQKAGSWIFIGEILTSLELDYDAPPPDRCGTCTRCIDACPTGAIVEPYVLDSRRCISYLTIELKGRIPHKLRDGMGNNIYGCDICQDVCPWNKRAEITNEPAFRPREALYNPELSSISSLGEDDFRRIFKSSPMKRTKRKGLVRNALIAMGNSGEKEFIPHVRKSLDDADPLVRTHAAWALWKLGGEESREILSSRLDTEADSMVMDEIISILSMMDKPEALCPSV